MRKTIKFAIAVLGLLFAESIVAQSAFEIEIYNYLESKDDNFSYNPSDFQNTIETDAYTSRGIAHKYLNQTWEGVPIFAKILSAASKENKLIYASHDFLALDQYTKISFTENLDASTVLSQAQEVLGINYAPEFQVVEISNPYRVKGESPLSIEPIFIEKAYVVVNKNLVPAWLVGVFHNDISEWWQYQIDARTGQLIDKISWTIECSREHLENENAHSLKSSGCEDHNHICESAEKNTRRKNTGAESSINVASSYEVFGLPLMTPQEGYRSIETLPWNDALNASPFGWHDTNGAAGAESTLTQGNNVRAVEDTNANNSGGTSPDGGTSLTFHYPMDLTTAPAVYQDAAITNLFYYNNIMHDVWYQYGFDEPSGNFQENNYSNGGNSSDRVNADAQDGSGTNNANFSTPPDGSNPRMQMYIWNVGDQVTFEVESPSNIAGIYFAVAANFGPSTGNFSGELIEAIPANACSPITNGAAINGKIAVINRGGCDFTDKVLAAQNEGAIGAIICQNTNGPPTTLGGTNNAITIPSFMLSQTDCNLIKAEIPTVDVEFWLNSTGELDSDMDNGVIAHEYGHGISNRLTGGPSSSSCLNGSEQMGEGWSDYMGLIMSIKSGDLGSDARGIGTYLNSEAPYANGIRSYPYSTDFAENPHTYDDIKTESVPHGVGSVWAAMLWEMTWELIAEYGFDSDIYDGTGGNNIAMNLVIEGMKLQPCNPGFVDGRDGILAADAALYAGANECLIWDAFSRRGLGFSATQGTSSSRSDGTEAYDLPPVCTEPLIVNKLGNSVAGANGVINYDINFTNNSGITQTNVDMTDILPSGVNYIPNTLNLGTENSGTINYIQPSVADGITTNVTFDVQVDGTNESQLIEFEGFETDWSSWLVSSGQGSSTFGATANNVFRGDTAIYVQNVGANNTQYLTFENLTLPANPFLTFYHNYNTENGWDGGFVEISQNGGTSWQDINTMFTVNGYNSSLGNGSNNDIDNRAAFTGNSFGYIRSWADLSILANQTIDLRFVFGSDNNTFEDGWYIDDIMVYDMHQIVNEVCVTTLQGLNNCATVSTYIVPDCELYLDVFVDADGDGFGDPATGTYACTYGTGFATNGLDCDDTNDLVFPSATELCDNIDNNCDGQVDENCGGTNLICDGQFIQVNPVVNNAYHAEIQLRSDAVVPNNFDLDFTAGDEILLLSGFETPINTDFHAWIEACLTTLQDEENDSSGN